MKKFLRTTSLWVLLLPVASTFAGVASNQSVLIVNGDKFPVLLNDKKAAVYINASKAKENSPDDWKMPAIVENATVMLDNEHCLMTKDTHLNFLADVFDFKTGIYSVGDGLLELGDWLFGFCPFVFLFDVCRKLKDQKE